ncbi:MAG TPA: hypothetical protein VF337_00725 [Candidatus Limnocylindrales bacterium]
MDEQNRTDSRAEAPALFSGVGNAFFAGAVVPNDPETMVDPTLDPDLNPRVWPLDAGSEAGIEAAGTSADEESSSGLVGHLQSVADAGAGVIGTVIDVANMALSIRDGPIARRLARQAREPLANLYEIFPESRNASPHELGMRFVPVEEIRGTAVAGYAQRGGDFLPLKPFRGENWTARWQRLREANDRLQPLPPVDLIKYDGEYWVVDGHNRVAVTLYANGVGLDAMVTELVPLDGQTSERPRNLLAYMGEAAELRAAASGHRPAMGMRQVEQRSADEAAVLPEAEREARAKADTERAADATMSAIDAGNKPSSLGEAD